MSIKFDPRKVVVSFNNVPLSGFAGGTFISCNRRKPFGALEELGADGEGAFVLSGDHSYVIELTLKKASPSNTILSQFAKATTIGAPVVGPFNVQDLSMFALFDAEEVMLVESPPWVREGGDKLGDNVWKFHAKKGTEYQPGSAA